MIAIAMMKIMREFIGRSCIVVTLKREIATRLMWIPGIRPVNVPEMMPSIRGVMRFSIASLCRFYY